VGTITWDGLQGTLSRRMAEVAEEKERRGDIGGSMSLRLVHLGRSLSDLCDVVLSPLGPDPKW
jgi:hypothetical protein